MKETGMAFTDRGGWFKGMPVRPVTGAFALSARSVTITGSFNHEEMIDEPGY